MRKHYLTICTRGADIEVTHINRGNFLEVCFEQSCNKGFNTLIVKHTGEIISNIGFNASDIAYLINFLKRNVDTMLAEARGEL